MPYDPEKHHRRSVRLPDYDYRQPGGYFVTICVQDRVCLFGEVDAGAMHLNRTGRIVQQQWCRIPRNFPHVSLDAYVVMPNHLHGIIVINAHGDASGHGDAADGAGGRRGEAFAADLEELSRDCKAAPSNSSLRSLANASPLQRRPIGTDSGSLSAVVQNFKSVVTRRINRVCKTPGESFWQRGYYEHVIRGRRDLERIRRYVEENPARWGHDRYYIH